VVTSTNELRFDDRRDDSEFTVPGGPADEMGELFSTIMTG
jgi:hypothetical protein